VNKNVISIDETSVDISITSNYGFAKKGTKCIINKVFKRKRFTIIMTMTKRKILLLILKVIFPTPAAR
jgi:hypothetical protein